jgi:hypothetical protein
MIAKTDTAGTHFDPNLAGPGRGEVALDEFDVGFGFGDDGNFHLRQVEFLLAWLGCRAARWG